ncbi:bacteriophage spanin2 family protein [Kaistella faecalis]|uniref:bacteriophage spanin2 family protein n=1 Tax=Kaistella faecalis TaxID=2852098 RepID=UPI001A1AAED3|nr:bacteriophage spanin2 family protein [Chryseobacterium faecale]MBH1958919.1 bacteriophage spanin2 family protein [Flavobacteriia bacterium]MBH2024536.1 bacteriophage spanin2 family protein [Flavobacteriales bacterium]UFK98953.1 bacteriophage spanin2 family protein [Chryseobacterium faecale]
MKKYFSILTLLIILILTSCQTRVVSVQKPMQKNSLELYQKYTVQTNDGKMTKMEVLKQDETTIYGKTKTGEDIAIAKSDVREVKKVDIFSSIILGLAAVAAVVFIPI